MELITVRHGEKAFMSGPRGPVLTPSGERQAQAFAQMWLPRVKAHSCLLLVSEKIRTEQTLAPLAAGLGLKVQADARLNERSHNETEPEFFRRILHLTEQMEAQQPQKDFVFWCSHFDVLETGMQVMEDKVATPFSKPYWRPASFVHFSFTEGHWQWLNNGETP